MSSRMAYGGTLSCSVTTAAACTGTVIYRMSGAANAHAELPSQTTAAYANNVVCCTGVTGLGTSCTTGATTTALKLSGVTNAHVQQTGSYVNDACISVTAGGTVSVGYQATNCTGFDTTLGSMSAATNAQVGNSAAYAAIQICGTAAAGGTVSCSTSVASTDFGLLDSSSITTASPNASTTMTCDFATGCSLFVQDAGDSSNPGLATTSPAYLIPSVTATLVAGVEGYGIQGATTTVGSGNVLNLNPAYNVSANNVGQFFLAAKTLASSTAAITNREVLVTHKVAISGLTVTAKYVDTITYSCTGN